MVILRDDDMLMASGHSSRLCYNGDIWLYILVLLKHCSIKIKHYDNIHKSHMFLYPVFTNNIISVVYFTEIKAICVVIWIL